MLDLQINDVSTPDAQLCVEFAGSLAIVTIHYKGGTVPPPWTQWLSDNRATINGRTFRVRPGSNWPHHLVGTEPIYEWSCRCVGSFPFSAEEWRHLEAEAAIATKPRGRAGHM